jgi:hypothetical protein
MVTVNTGIAIEEDFDYQGEHYPGLFDFLHDEAQRHGWRWRLINTKYDYTQWCLDNGMPGVDVHGVVMGKLKYQTYRDYYDSLNDNSVAYISGVHKNESDRRNKKYPYHVDESDGMIMGRIVFYWKTNQIYEYCVKNDIKISPIHRVLHFSGDCGCGCFASSLEAMLIKEFFPEFHNKIKTIESNLQIKIKILEEHLHDIKTRIQNTSFNLPELEIQKLQISDKIQTLKKFSKWGHGLGMSELEKQKLLSDFKFQEDTLSDSCEECNIMFLDNN